jgi:hypothetical protein
MLAVVLAPMLMATTCIRFKFIEVDVSAGHDEASPPVFSFSHDRVQLMALKRFQVTDCWGTNGRSVWTLVPNGVVQHAVEPLRITYARVPLGYREEAPAPPLQPGGCYRAVAEGVPSDEAIDEGRETFRVLPGGRVVVGQPEGIVYNSPAFRQLNRAAVGCARGYRRALSAVDSAAVERREYRVVDQRLSCGWLYEHWPDVMSDQVATERALAAALGGIATVVGIVLLSEQIPEPE